MEADIRTHLLPYVERLDRRDPAAIRRIVIHATELPDLATARTYGERIHHEQSRTGNSGHFYIDRDGRIERWVPVDRIAHHVRGHNADSIGIELVNTGRYPDWFDSRRQDWTEPYPDAQIDALVALVRGLKRQLPAIDALAGHDQLDLDRIEASDDPSKTVRRKTDPGPAFPWTRLTGETGLPRMKAGE